MLTLIARLLTNFGIVRNSLKIWVHCQVSILTVQDSEQLTLVRCKKIK